MTNESDPLDALRQEIDAIDDQVHDLIMRRTRVVERVRDLKEGQPVKIRPSREAEILVRLMGRHGGPFPKRELVRIWRELIVATLSFEGPFSIAVHHPETGCGYAELARNQYGSFTPMSTHASAQRVIDAVSTHEATVGVLPLPRPGEDRNPWWRHLAYENESAPRVIARLPFTGTTGGATDELEALVICPIGLQETGRDRSLIAIEAEERLGTAALRSALAGAGLEAGMMDHWRDSRDEGPWLVLVELETHVGRGAPELDRLAARLGESVNRIISLGGYARPLSAEELAPADG